MKISNPTMKGYITIDAIEAINKAHELMSSLNVDVRDYEVSYNLDYVLVTANHTPFAADQSILPRYRTVVEGKTYLINVRGPVATVEDVFAGSMGLPEVYAHFAVEAVKEILDKINTEPVRIDVFIASLRIAAYVYQDGKPRVFTFSTESRKVELEEVRDGHNVEPKDEVEVRFSYD